MFLYFRILCSRLEQCHSPRQVSLEEWIASPISKTVVSADRHVLWHDNFRHSSSHLQTLGISTTRIHARVLDIWDVSQGRSPRGLQFRGDRLTN